MQRMQVAECDTTPGHLDTWHLSTLAPGQGRRGAHGRLCRNNKSKLFPKRSWFYPLSFFVALKIEKIPQIEGWRHCEGDRHANERWEGRAQERGRVYEEQ